MTSREFSPDIATTPLHERVVTEKTTRAVPAPEVDATLVTTLCGQQPIYILETEDWPYRRLVEGMSDGAALVSAEGRIIYANQGLATLLDIPQERLLGRLFSDWVDEPDRLGFAQLLTSAPSSLHGEHTLRHSGGGSVPVLVGITITEESEGSFRYLTVTDLSQQSAHQQEVQRLNDELTERLLELRQEQAKALDRLMELERFQRLTIGRELKMISLKEEIEVLKKAQPRPRRQAG